MVGLQIATRCEEAAETRPGHAYMPVFLGLSSAGSMNMTRIAALLILVLLISATLMQAGEPTATTFSTEAVQVLGFGDVPDNTKGILELTDGSLHFTSSKASFAVVANTIQDVVTGDDTQRAIRGPVGTISQFGPYGSGRALSLLRTKIDTFTIEYRDSDGALHGAIFTMAVGKAGPLKEKLLSQGAQTSIPISQIVKQTKSQPHPQEVQ